MKWFTLLILTLLLALAGCGDKHSTINPVDPGDTTATVEPVKPGKLSLQATKTTLAKMVAVTDSEATGTDIELGLVKTSKAFFFILRNVGGAPIESLTISSDVPNVSMAPGFIPVLQTDDSSTITQIAELDVIHGTDINTKAPIKTLLPYGRSEVTLSFDGVSLGQPFHAEFKLGLEAIYVSMLDDPLDTLMRPISLLDTTMVYQGKSCTVYNSYTRLDAGDLMYKGSDALGGSEPIALRWLEANITSDCVIRNLLPEELQ